MSWKLVGGILILFLTSGAVWTALGVATVADVDEHNTDHDSHPQLKKTVDDAVEVIVTVRNGMYEDRAERLADRVADKIESPRRSRDVWKEVRDKAIDNQERKKPLRDGLQRYLD